MRRTGRRTALLLALAGSSAEGAEARAIWLDAGPLDGIVAPRFEPLTPAGSADPRARWTQPPVRVETGAWPDSLVGDGLWGGSLHLDLPPGPHTLWVWLDPGLPDAARITAEASIRVDDRVAWSRQPPAAGAALPASPVAARPRFDDTETVWHRQVAPLHPWVRLSVEAGPAGLDLAVRGTALAALAVTPGQRDEGARAALAAVSADRRAFHHTHHDVFSPPPPSLAGPLRLTHGTLGEPPSDDAPTATRIVVRMPAGGRAWVPIWALGSDATTAVDVRGLGGLDVSSWEMVWRDGAGPPGAPRGVYPSWLAPCDGQLLAGQGLPPGVALELRAAPEARGRQRGVLTVRRGSQTTTVALLVDVVGHLAPDPPVHTGLILSASPVLTAIDGAGAPRVLEQLDADLTRMRRLGFDVVSVRDTLRGAPLGDERRVFDHVAHTWADLGGTTLFWADPKAFVRSSMYAEGTLPPARAAERVLALLTSLADDPPPVPVVVPMWEEELWKHADALAQAPRMRAWVTAGVPRPPPLAATLGHPDATPAAAAFDAVLLGRGAPLSRTRVDALRTTTEVWSYNQGLDQSGPWSAWRAGVGLMLQWHWNAHPDLPWFDAAPHDRDVHAAPGPDGQLWHSVQVVALAQGVEDTRVLDALQRALQAPPPGRAPWVAEARALLAAARGEGALAEPRQLGGRGLDPAAMQALADRALVLLARLEP